MSFVNTEGISGTDTLIIGPDGKLSLRQSVIFSGTDSGFDYVVKGETGVDGEWRLAGDTIKVRYDASSFAIRWMEEGSDVKKADADSVGGIPEEQKALMLGDLRRAFEENYKSVYHSLEGGYNILGCVGPVGPDVIELTNGGEKIQLIREKR